MIKIAGEKNNKNCRRFWVEPIRSLDDQELLCQCGFRGGQLGRSVSLRLFRTGIGTDKPLSAQPFRQKPFHCYKVFM